MSKRSTKIFTGVLATLVACTATAVAVLVYQAHRSSLASPDYVALGSSFAAGLGLGERAPGSPFMCQRSINGYPEQLARATTLSLVDMTCSGSTAEHVLHGGQYFQGPQLDAVKASTRLVTLTSGGNDISYIGDLIGLGYGNRGGLTGALAALVLRAPHSSAARHLEQAAGNLGEIIAQVHVRAPTAQVVVATYPPVLPPQGTCAALGLTVQQADLMRAVAAQLAEVTRAAAHAGGALLVDMDQLGQGHDACSEQPWTNGLAPATGTSFHPTLAGAEATAQAIVQATRLTQARSSQRQRE